MSTDIYFEFASLLSQNGDAEDLYAEDLYPGFAEWIASRTPHQVYEECKRPDLMLEVYVARVGYPNWPTWQQVVLVGCTCAERALCCVPESLTEPLEAISCARRWANGEGNRKEVTLAGVRALKASDHWARRKLQISSAAELDNLVRGSVKDNGVLLHHFFKEHTIYQAYSLACMASFRATQAAIISATFAGTAAYHAADAIGCKAGAAKPNMMIEELATMAGIVRRMLPLSDD